MQRGSCGGVAFNLPNTRVAFNLPRGARGCIQPAEGGTAAHAVGLPGVAPDDTIPWDGDAFNLPNFAFYPSPALPWWP